MLRDSSHRTRRFFDADDELLELMNTFFVFGYQGLIVYELVWEFFERLETIPDDDKPKEIYELVRKALKRRGHCGNIGKSKA